MSFAQAGMGEPPRPSASDHDRSASVSLFESNAAIPPSPDDLPSGRWHGYYVQRFIRERRQNISMGWAVRGSFIEGLGVEAACWFSIDGCYDRLSRRVWLVKHYIGGGTALYHGYYDDHEIRGYWELPNRAIAHTGPFVLHPGDSAAGSMPQSPDGIEPPHIERPCPRCGKVLSIVPEVDLTCGGCGAMLDTVVLIHGGTRIWNMPTARLSTGAIRRMVGAAAKAFRGKASPDAPSATGRASAILCLGCGYDLTGLPSRHRCPECGLHYDHTSRWLFADHRPRGPVWFLPEICLGLATLSALVGGLTGVRGMVTVRPDLLLRAVGLLGMSLMVLVVGLAVNKTVLSRFRRARERGGGEHRGHYVVADDSGVVVAGPPATRVRIPWQTIGRAEYDPTRNQLRIVGPHQDILVAHTFARTDSLDRIRLQNCALEISRLAHLRRVHS